MVRARTYFRWDDDAQAASIGEQLKKITQALDLAVFHIKDSVVDVDQGKVTISFLVDTKRPGDGARFARQALAKILDSWEDTHAHGPSMDVASARKQTELTPA